MIVGLIIPCGDATVTLNLRGPTGALLELQTVIDTGFNGALAFSHTIVKFLELECVEDIRYALADGSEAVTRVVAVEVLWHGNWRDIRALEMDGGTLLGMNMLKDCSLHIDVIPGGRVEIRPLP